MKKTDKKGTWVAISGRMKLQHNILKGDGKPCLGEEQGMQLRQHRWSLHELLETEFDKIGLGCLEQAH